MGKIFTLTNDIKSVIQNALDDLITELGKNCTLVYPSIYSDCVNCQPDPIGSKGSTHWRTGGPMKFATGAICPLCNGEQKREEQVTEDVKFLCSFEPKKFFIPIPNIKISQGDSYLQIKGYLTDLPKVMQAEYLLSQTPISGIMKKRYELFSEPGDVSNIIQNRYFVATYKQA